MQQSITSNKRIAKNSFLLYVRMVVVMVINIYAVRVVLHALGEEDYGIYNVVSGFVTSLVFVNNALQSATQRFFSYAIGKNDEEELRTVFSVSIKCYLVIVAVFLLICETIGLWFVNTQLVIPEARIGAANIVYQFAIFAVIASFLYLPYSSLLIAFERMNIWAYISIAHSVILLLLSIALKYLGFDRLIVYSIFVLIAWLFVFLCYWASCKKFYPSICVIKKGYSKPMLKNILSFSGWSLYGHLAGVMNNQGNTILLNIFFGPIVNTARAISLQVHSALVTLAGNFSMAFRPPIVKCYAAGDYAYLNSLYLLSNKCIFYCLLLVCIPLTIETRFVLTVWLGEVSENMILFTKWSIWYAFILSLSAPITTVMQASGNIKKYHLIVETLTLLSMPLTYVLFKIGFPPVSTFVVTFGIFSLAHILRLIVLEKEVRELTITSYLVNFLIVGILIFIVSMVSMQLFTSIYKEGWVRLLLGCVINVTQVSLLAYFLAINKAERSQIKNLIKHVFKK